MLCQTVIFLLKLQISKKLTFSNNINGDPSQWIWVTKEMVPDNLEEVCGIDNENYVIISDENVVDGIAEFIAKLFSGSYTSKVSMAGCQRFQMVFLCTDPGFGTNFVVIMKI